MHLGKLIPEVCVDGMTPNAKMTTDKGRHVFSGVVSSISKVHFPVGVGGRGKGLRALKCEKIKSEVGRVSESVLAC
jgi:hypothetical protein